MRALITLGVLVGGGSVVLGYTGQALFLPNWFVRRRGLALSVAFSGVGVGSIILLPWLQTLIQRAGWRAACWALAAADFLERQRSGVLMALAADDTEGQARFTAFLQGLREFGLDRRPQRAHRHALDCWQCRRDSQVLGGIRYSGS